MNWLRCAWLLLACALGAHAQPPATVAPLALGDEQYLEQQRRTVRELAALHLGRSVTGQKVRDLETLQLMLDQGVVGTDDARQLQALGVVMGDLLAGELDMHWVIYTDGAGRSRALQLGDSMNFLFPITMISRRVKADVEVRVADVYARAVAEMAPQAAQRYRREPAMP
jgi:hypothetical protein